MAFSKIGNLIIPLVNKGKTDLEQHSSSFELSKNIRSTYNSNQSILLLTQNSKIEGKITAAEATLVFCTIRHH